VPQDAVQTLDPQVIGIAQRAINVKEDGRNAGSVERHLSAPRVCFQLIRIELIGWHHWLSVP